MPVFHAVQTSTLKTNSQRSLSTGAADKQTLFDKSKIKNNQAELSVIFCY